MMENTKTCGSSEVLSKMQGRPLPAPPRPPRSRKDRSIERSTREIQQEIAMETTTATQTDPLPDDFGDRGRSNTGEATCSTI